MPACDPPEPPVPAELPGIVELRLRVALHRRVDGHHRRRTGLRHRLRCLLDAAPALPGRPSVRPLRGEVLWRNLTRAPR